MRQKVMNRIPHVQITIFIKAILESPYKVLLGPYILVAPTRPVFFFNGRWVLRNFWHLDCYNFCGILRKKCEIILFRSLLLISENTPKIISIGPPIMEKRPFKKLKILAFLVPFISKTKKADIFNFSSVKYFGKRLSFLKIWHIWVNHCWNYGPPNLLFRFTRLVTSVGKFSNYRCLRFES